MQEDYLNYPQTNIPAFNQAKAYAFDAPDLELYRELNEISEEIGRCRSAHLE